MVYSLEAFDNREFDDGDAFLKCFSAFKP